jgi:hypothetical protein
MNTTNGWFTRENDSFIDSYGGEIPVTTTNIYGALLATVDTLWTNYEDGATAKVWFNFSDDAGDNYRVAAFLMSGHRNRLE